jgi:hypothetical protein
VTSTAHFQCFCWGDAGLGLPNLMFDNPLTMATGRYLFGRPVPFLNVLVISFTVISIADGAKNCLYFWFNDAFSGSDHVYTVDWLNVKWKVYEKKQSWPI